MTIPSELIPNVEECPSEKCKHMFDESDNFLVSKPNTLYWNRDCNFKIKVYNYKCPACGKIQIYDGLKDKIINFKTEILANHDVFNAFHFLLSIAYGNEYVCWSSI